jgi:acyl-CoA thioesterase
VEVEAEVLGAGRSASQIQVSLYSTSSPGDPERVLSSRVFAVAGASRASQVRVEPGPADLRAGDPAGQGTELPYIAGLTPEFIRHTELRWCSPALPFSSAGPEGAVIDGWARHRTPAEGLAALIALLDAWPPALVPMFDRPSPGSSVRWAIHLADSRPGPGREWTGKEWVWQEVRTVQAGNGYATTVASSYDADGRLLAWAEQLIAVYDKPRPPAESGG